MRFLRKLWDAPLYIALNMKRSTYNGVVATIGCFLYTETFTQFIGLLLIAECFMVTVEACWPKDADD